MRSGSSASILSNRAEMNDETFGFCAPRADGACNRRCRPRDALRPAGRASRWSLRSGRRCAQDSAHETSAKTKPVAVHDLAGVTVTGWSNIGPIVRERMELAALAARVDAGRQVASSASIELPAGERSIEMLRVDAGENRAKPAVDHLVGQLIGRNAPERKQRRQAGAGEPVFAILADVLEKQIAECDVREAFRPPPARRPSACGLRTRRSCTATAAAPSAAALRPRAPAPRAASDAPRASPPDRTLHSSSSAARRSSTAGSCFSMCSIHALSLPELHETRTFIGLTVHWSLGHRRSHDWSRLVRSAYAPQRSTLSPGRPKSPGHLKAPGEALPRYGARTAATRGPGFIRSSPRSW